MIDTGDLGSLWELWVVFVVLAVIGGILSRRAFVAARGRSSNPLLLLAGGLAVLTIGMPVTWTSLYILSGDMFLCTISSSLATLVGVSLLLGSIYLRTG